MQEFNEILEKTLANDYENFQILYLAIKTKTLTSDEANVTYKAIENMDSANALCLKSLLLCHFSSEQLGIEGQLPDYIPLLEAAEKLDHPESMFELAMLADNKQREDLLERSVEAIFMHEQALPFYEKQDYQNTISLLYQTMLKKSPATMFYHANILQNKTDHKEKIAILYRRSIENETNILDKHYFFQCFEKLFKYDSHYNYFIYYHFMMMNWKENGILVEKNYPEARKNLEWHFLKLLNKDEDLSKNERLKIAYHWMIKHKLEFSKKTDGEEIWDLLNEAWLEKSVEFIRLQEPLHAIWALQNVAADSKHYSRANHDIARILYNEVLKRNPLENPNDINSPESTAQIEQILEYIKPFIQIGLKQNYKESIEFYERVYSTSPISFAHRLRILTTVLPLVFEQVVASREIEEKEIQLVNDGLTNFVGSFIKNDLSHKFFCAKRYILEKTLQEKILSKLTPVENDNVEILKIAQYLVQQIENIKKEFKETQTNTTYLLATLKTQVIQLILDIIPNRLTVNPDIQVLIFTFLRQKN